MSTGAAVTTTGVAAAAAEVPAPPVITIAGPATPRPAPAVMSTAAVSAKIHHYNICNAKREACTIEQAATARDVLVWMAVADGAWFISVNEICVTSFRTLADRLNSAGTFVVSKQRETNCGNQEFGNAIFHPGGVRQDGRAWFLSNPGKTCTDAETECRTMLCLKLGTYAGPMGQCTSHLGAGKESDTIHQAAEYIWNATAWMEPGRRFSLAGDFNLTRDKLPGAYGNMVDLVLGDTFPTRPKTNRQIDYIFVQAFGSHTYKSAYCPTDASDHCYTSGQWRPLDTWS
ncbi:hypothetical protein AB0873_21940 [Micromonospora sp. NPDC047707]|uniref:hypothetical protein n=1 Tax=Micromonospora sp. NPDC047707 TaxID=3154498 RepID=UPI0034570AB2